MKYLKLSIVVAVFSVSLKVNSPMVGIIFPIISGYLFARWFLISERK